MSDQYPMDRNGAMEQSKSVGPLTRIATPAHLGPIMSPLHITECPLSPNPSAAQMLGTRCGRLGTRRGRVDPCGLPLGGFVEPREARAVSWPVWWVLAMPLHTAYCLRGGMPRTDVMRALLELS